MLGLQITERQLDCFLYSGKVVKLIKEVTECDLEEYKSLQARIDALRAELEGDDEEEEDDDGDIVVRV